MVPRTTLLLLIITSLLAPPDFHFPKSHLIGLFELALSTAPTASLQTRHDDKYSVRGTVVNSVTGEPIHGALVQIYVNGQSSMLTGPDGKFQFDGLPVGHTSSINARKPGFFSEDELQSGALRQGMVNIGPNSSPVVLKLTPEGIIYGRISEEDGEPLEALPVILYVQALQNGRKVWQQGPRAQTDEDGNFRIAELQPGNYFLSAGPSRNPVTFSSKPSQPARGIPVVYYPGGSDPTAAATVSVAPGKKVEADFKISPQPFYRISGSISGYAPGQAVNLQIRSALGIPFPYSSRFDPASGIFLIPWAPAGSYTLQASVPDSRGDGLTATIPLTVGADLSGVHLVLLPTVTIPIETQVVSSRAGAERFWEQKNFLPVSVRLIGHNSGLFEPTYGSQQTGEGGAATLGLHGIPPGTYSVEIYPSGPLYVQEAVSGITNLLDSDFSISPGSSPQPIEITLRDDAANLSGIVFFNNKPLTAAVLAISGHPSISPRIIPTDASGAFQFPFLPPGSYKILALDHPDRLEYTNPDAMRNYLSKAREITLSPDQSAKIDLELVRVGD